MPDRELWLLDDGRIMGGGQLFALRLADARPLTIVCPPGSELAAAGEAAGVRVVPAAFPDPADVAGLARAVPALRRAVGPGVVVANAIRTSLVAGPALARRSDCTLVHLLHERDSAERRTVRLALARSRRIVAVGAVAADAYRRALPRAHVGVLNNFLGPQRFDELAEARRERTGGVVGVLARLIPEKGVAEVVDELAAVPEAWKRAVLAGGRQDEAYARTVERRAAALGARVSLPGHVDDVMAFLSGIDVLVVPSTGNEAQPTVILEALAAGVPVVARRPLVSADFAGLPVTPYDDAASLAAALAARPAAADPAVLADRFGPEQALAAIVAAAA